MSRVHVGCGTRNPWKRWLWITWALAVAVSVPVNLLLHVFWGFLAYLPEVLVIACMFRWEYVHSASKMFRTWYP